jgi:hypothetical protein
VDLFQQMEETVQGNTLTGCSNMLHGTQGGKNRARELKGAWRYQKQRNRKAQWPLKTAEGAHGQPTTAQTAGNAQAWVRSARMRTDAYGTWKIKGNCSLRWLSAALMTAKVSDERVRVVAEAVAGAEDFEGWQEKL